MLVDKTVTSPVDGLHTSFRIVRDARNRQSVVVDPHFSPDEFGQLGGLFRIGHVLPCQLLEYAD